MFSMFSGFCWPGDFAPEPIWGSAAGDGTPSFVPLRNKFLATPLGGWTGINGERGRDHRRHEYS